MCRSTQPAAPAVPAAHPPGWWLGSSRRVPGAKSIRRSVTDCSTLPPPAVRCANASLSLSKVSSTACAPRAWHTRSPMRGVVRVRSRLVAAGRQQPALRVERLAAPEGVFALGEGGEGLCPWRHGPGGAGGAERVEGHGRGRQAAQRRDGDSRGGCKPAPRAAARARPHRAMLASATARAVMLSTRRTVAEEVSTCAGLEAPSMIGPTVTPPAPVIFSTL